MKFTSPPMATPRASRQPGDDVDALLSAYYQAEMPSPWPELQLPAPVSVLPNRLAFWHRVKQSHLALAASVALLVAGALVFADKSSVYRSSAPAVDIPPISSRPFDPNKVKESIVITPDGAAIRFESTDLEENRY
jgi:hypothetical protein